jgi:hypothetical protein
MNYRLVMVAGRLLAVSLAINVCGCNKPEKAAAATVPISVVSAGGSTFLVEPNEHKIFALNNGEFVTIPVVRAADFSGKNGLRNYRGEAKDLSILTNLKFYNGRLFYQISVSPNVAPEYQAYLGKWFQAISKKQPLPQQPVNKYQNPNWTAEVDKLGNSVIVSLTDTDGFEVTRVVVPVIGVSSANRTSILENDGVTRSYVKYEGNVAMTGGDFSRIKDANITYVLD